jgi:hypothetical protein
LLEDSLETGWEGTAFVVEVDMLIKPAMVVSEELWEIILRIVCSEVFSSAPRSSALTFLAGWHA